jgi:hypothetical protein
MEILHIDLDQIKEIALRGIRRATIFLGLGVNAARDKSCTNYQLPENNYLKLVPEKVSNEELTDFKENFEKWIIANGLRELIESFGVFLDRIHQACLLLATNKGQIIPQDADKFARAFEKKGIEGKLNKLHTRFSVLTDKEKYFPSINQVRNCITHRRGVVGVEDLKGNDTLQLVWWAMDIIALLPDGKEIPLIPIPEGGIYLKDGATVSIKIKDRNREYSFDEIIELTPIDVNEICFLVFLATNEIVASTVNYARSIGIEITEQKAAGGQGSSPDNVDTSN